MGPGLNIGGGWGWDVHPAAAAAAAAAAFGFCCRSSGVFACRSSGFFACRSSGFFACPSSGFCCCSSGVPCSLGESESTDMFPSLFFFFFSFSFSLEPAGSYPRNQSLVAHDRGMGPGLNMCGGWGWDVHPAAAAAPLGFACRSSGFFACRSSGFCFCSSGVPCSLGETESTDMFPSLFFFFLFFFLPGARWLVPPESESCCP